MSMELIVKPIENLGPIDFNFEALKEELKLALKKYQNLVYTDENIKEAKEDRAKLNKLLMAIDTKRKEIKKKWNEPYLEFEEKIKQLTGLIGEPLFLIDDQIRVVEGKKKSEKKTQIIHYWNDLICAELGSCIDFERFVFNEKWLNATEKIEKVYAEMETKITSIKKDLEVIENFEDKSKIVSLKQKYFKNLDLSESLRLQKIEDDEKKRIQEADQKRQEELKKETVESKMVNTGIQTEQVESVKNADILLKRTFEVEATADQLKILGDFMSSQNIKFKLIKRG